MFLKNIKMKSGLTFLGGRLNIESLKSQTLLKKLHTEPSMELIHLLALVGVNIIGSHQYFRVLTTHRKHAKLF